MPDDDGAPRGPAEVDPAAFFGDWDGELRRCADQHWWARGVDLTGDPLPYVLGWEANRALLTQRDLSPRSFVDDMLAAGLSAATAAQVAPLFSRHGDDHRQLRKVLAVAFTPAKVEQLRPAARRIAERLADGIVAQGGRCELVADFASPLPPEVFAVLFGLPVEDGGRLGGWASEIALAFSPMDADVVARVEAAAAALRDYSRARIEASRAAPGDDLVTRLLEAEVHGERLAEDDVVAMVTGFVFAGAETTRRQITAAVQLLAEHPADWERLRAEPELLPTAVDEVLRVRGIVPGLTRRAEADVVHDDLAVPAGGRLLLSFTAANHDPARFEDPHEFRVDRADAHAHLTFGWGPHLCVGAGLARLELAEGLRALLARFGPPVVEASGPSTGFGVPDALEVRFSA